MRIIPVTFLLLYDFCPRRLFLEQVLGSPPEPRPKLLLGRVRHFAHTKLHSWESQVLPGVTLPVNPYRITDLYKRHNHKVLQNAIIAHKSQLTAHNFSLIETYKTLWPGVIYESQDRANKVIAYLSRQEKLSSDWFDDFSPKLSHELMLSSVTLRLSGVVDRVSAKRDERTLIELKTGKMPEEGAWRSHRLQLAAYALLYRTIRGERPRAAVRYLDARHDRDVDVSDQTDAWVLTVKTDVEQLLASTELPRFVDNRKKCMVCPHKLVCYDEEQVRALHKERFA
ncbi:MAG: PD-(D/E)XK nuclease family protein [Candidatus Woesearchaeota archaeon]|nr:MAG: PD-(D/E)XK nuclease family protein [Candidatus Woesearchaeota archaeon]